jgi:hypothetical protein
MAATRHLEQLDGSTPRPPLAGGPSELGGYAATTMQKLAQLFNVNSVAREDADSAADKEMIKNTPQATQSAEGRRWGLEAPH